jgi:ribosomal protein L23
LPDLGGTQYSQHQPKCHLGQINKGEALSRMLGRRKDVKKAYVTRADGNAIDVSTGL